MERFWVSLKPTQSYKSLAHPHLIRKQSTAFEVLDFPNSLILVVTSFETPDLLTDIVLDRAASLFGRVVDENGKAIANARVRTSVDLGRARDVLKRLPSLVLEANTDKNGYYQLSDVPTGQLQVSVMSSRNFKIGHKKVDLKPGDSMELKFGDEAGDM